MITLRWNQATRLLEQRSFASKPFSLFAKLNGVGLWLALVCFAMTSPAFGWQSTDGPRLRPSTAPRQAPQPAPQPAPMNDGTNQANDDATNEGRSELKPLEPTQPPRLLDPPPSESTRQRDPDSVAAAFAEPLTPKNPNDPGRLPSREPSPAPRSTTPPPIRSIGNMTVVRQPTTGTGRDVMVGRPSMSNWSPTPARVGRDDPEANQQPSLPMRERAAINSPELNQPLSSFGNRPGDPQSLMNQPNIIMQPSAPIRNAPINQTFMDESFTQPRLPFDENAVAPTAPVVFPAGNASTWPNGFERGVRTANFTQQPPLQPLVMPNNNFGQVMPNQGPPPPTYPNQPFNGSVVPSPQGGVIPSPLDSSNLPRYQPRVVTQEPFVTAPPCRFDAYDMVSPANYQQCNPAGVMPIGGVPGGAPYTYAPPTVTPNMAPGLYAPNNSGWRPLFTLGQENYNAQLGRGLFGQPTAYVSGQPFRNFFRYVFP